MTFNEWWEKRQPEIIEILSAGPENFFSIKDYFENAWMNGKYASGED